MSDRTDDGVSRQSKRTAGESRLLTKRQLADDLQVTVRTLDRWLLEGNLPSGSRIKVGRVVRFHKEAIHAWLESRRKPTDD